MSEVFVVSIDGPAASGKSTVSRLLAKKLQGSWLSTGIFYRGLAFLVSQLKIETSDTSKILSVLNNVQWEVQIHPQETQFYYKGKNYTQDLKGEEVGALASLLAANPSVRLALLEKQRQMKSLAKNVFIAEGRDCASVVFPESDLKVFISASLEDRAKRRSLETGRLESLVKDQQKHRDQQDRSRKAAPLKIHADALCVNSSLYSAEEIVDQLYASIKKLLKPS
ncbi:MAG: (d)CMP kinase [Bdellovibrionaceae bacterium]|nr:(d)CMP kinase [Pseudobdellovibrionaceae bacterium]